MNFCLRELVVIKSGMLSTASRHVIIRMPRIDMAVSVAPRAMAGGSATAHMRGTENNHWDVFTALRACTLAQALSGVRCRWIGQCFV